MSKKSVWKITFMISCIALIAVMAGCSVGKKEASNSGASSEASSSPSAAAASDHTLVVDLSSEPSTLDPGLQYNSDSYIVYRNIFDQLMTRDPKTSEIKAGIAESWKQDSETQWTFKIHDNVTFHNGEKLTAADAAYSLNRILDKDFKSPQYANFSMIESAVATDNNLVITTSEPSPTLLTQLVNLSIIPEKYVTEIGNEKFNLQPIGSGPYKFVEWSKGNRVTLTANDTYWEGKPQIAGVEFRFVPTPASRVADLQSGKADVIVSLSPDDTETITADKKLQVLSSPTERVGFLAFNVLGDTPTQSLQLRKAIAHGINYDALIDSLLLGYGERVTQVLTPMSFGYDDTIPGFDYDTEKAKQYLAEAGYANGVTIEFNTSPTYDQRVVQAIQGDLAKIGITVNISSTDQPTFLKKVQDPEHKWGSLRFGVWSCSCMDADGTIFPLFHTGTIWSSYSNEAFDAAVEAARMTTDSEARKTHYQAALKVLQEDVPGVGLYQTNVLYGASNKLEWEANPQESFFVKTMKWTE